MRIQTAAALKVAAVITAAPRLVTALMRAEGFEIPASWLVWWTPASAIANLGMAVLEGAAFAFIFAAWRQSSGRNSRILMGLAIFSACLFAATVAPSVYVSSRYTLIGQVLPAWALWLWSVSVTLSTIAVVGSVGYATKPNDNQVEKIEKIEKHKIIVENPTDNHLIISGKRKKRLTTAENYAETNGVSLSTAYRHLPRSNGQSDDKLPSG